ncbi:MAG: hypothetical protein AB7F66_09240 [Bacteriovoracia bacterium]
MGNKLSALASIFIIITGCSKAVEFTDEDGGTQFQAQSPTEIPQSVLDRLTVLETTITNQNTRIEKLVKVADEYGAILTQHKEMLDRLNARDEEFKALIAELRGNLDGLAATVQHQDAKIAYLAEKSAQHDGILEQHKNLIAKHDHWLEKLTHLVEKHEKYFLNWSLEKFDARIGDLEKRTQFQTVDTIEGKPAVVFDKVNLVVRNGMGKTWTENGVGNLIVGYNEMREDHAADTAARHRTGSHYVVTGSWNDYLGYGGIASGAHNTVTGSYNTITGGHNNLVAGKYSSVSGGKNVRVKGAAHWAAGGYRWPRRGWAYHCPQWFLEELTANVEIDDDTYGLEYDELVASGRVDQYIEKIKHYCFSR